MTTKISLRHAGSRAPGAAGLRNKRPPGGVILHVTAVWKAVNNGGGGMSLKSFISKQFIDIIQWTEQDQDTLAWRFPMQDMEIQNGGSLTVRESQMAVFVNEGKVADVFGPGTYKLTTQTLPVLTYLKNWDKLFESPFKSDGYFFITRLKTARKRGTPHTITLRDADFGMVPLRAFVMYSYGVVDARQCITEINGTR